MSLSENRKQKSRQVYNHVYYIFLVISLFYVTLSHLHKLCFFLRYGYFSGINRKIQFKYLGKPRDGNESESSESRQSSESRDSGSDERSGKRKQGKDSKNKHTEANDEKEVKRKESKETKTQTGEEPKETEEVDRKGSEDKLAVPVDKDHSLLLIVKWGGELTTMGKEQALQLGRAFR